MLPSFRAFHEGEQHACYLCENPCRIGALPLGPAGPHLDAFIVSLEARGYPPRRMLHLIRGVKRFSHWAQAAGLTLQELDANALEAFGQHLRDLQRLHYPSGRYSHLFVGARHFVHFLEMAGFVAPSAPATLQCPDPELLGAFRQLDADASGNNRCHPQGLPSDDHRSAAHAR